MHKRCHKVIWHKKLLESATSTGCSRGVGGKDELYQADRLRRSLQIRHRFVGQHITIQLVAELTAAHPASATTTAKRAPLTPQFPSTVIRHE